METDPQVPGAPDVTLDEVIDEVGERWDCRAVSGGFVGIPRGKGPGLPIPRVGSTPAVLLARIRAVDGRS
ncbi:MAG: hypothetical protein ABSF03_33445 [Streptosporangiaceae bacterium]